MKWQPLFLITRDEPSGARSFWTCSEVHGCGWADTPKHAFTPREVELEMHRLLREDATYEICVRRIAIA